MWFRSMLKSLTRSSRGRQQSAADRKQQARRLLLEGLEDRRLLAFLPAASYDAGVSPHVVVTADFNNDTHLDLAVANYNSCNVSVLLGNASGTFQPAQNSPTGSGCPQSVAVGDFDGDGKLDLAAANIRDVSVFKGNGDGDFAAPFNIGIDSFPTSVAVGDFNGDGKLDLGVTGNKQYPGGCDPYYGCSGGGYAGYAYVLLGNGSGSFSAPISNLISGDYYSSAASADFNGDGLQDFAAIDGYGTVAVLSGTSTGALGSPAYFFAGYGASSLIAKDVNGDFKADIVTANMGPGSVNVLVGDGLGSFAATQSYAAGSSPSAVAIADFNGDLRSDLIAANADDNTVSVLLGTPSGTFKPPVNVATGALPVGVAVGDFNGDGRADAATANHVSDQVSVLLNDATWPALDAPSITIADATVTEENAGTVDANFTVSLSAQYNQPVSVVYSTQDFSATGGSDYQTKTETLTFAPGEWSKIVSIPVIGDRIGESSESFFVKLSDPLNAFVADATGLGTILDDEPVVSIDGYFSDVEGHTATKAFTFTVSLSNEYDMPVTVDYSTADLTLDEQYWYGPGATAGDDYTATSGTVTFAAHQTTSETITVLVSGDRLAEYDELFFVNLSNPSGARLGAAQALATIVNDEPYVWIESAASIPEGNSGTTAMTFTLHLSAPYDIPVTVDYTTVDGLAIAGSDYVAVAGTATIAASTTSQTITVLVNGDTLAEGDEYLAVSITAVSGAQLSGGSAYGTILNDDTPPAIYIGDASIVEGNSGTRTMSFTVSLSYPSGQGIYVNYATANGTATTSNNDYLAVSAWLGFAAGETSKTSTVTIRGDTRKEANEYFLVKLSGAVGATIADGQGQGTIVNDDGGGGGKGNAKGNRSDSFALAVDAAIDDWMASTPKKRGR